MKLMRINIFLMQNEYLIFIYAKYPIILLVRILSRGAFVGWGFCKMANELQLNKINNNTQVRITKAKVAKIIEIL